MKRKLKQILSMSLAIVMVGSLCTIGAYATNAEQIQVDANAQHLIVDSLGKDQLNNTTVQTVSHDLKLLEKASLAEFVQIDTINSNGSVTYAIPYESVNTVEYITIKEDAIGNTVLDITDGAHHNKLVFTTDGRIVLDGYEIKFEDTSTPIRIQDSANIEPKAGAYTKFYGCNATLDNRGKPTTPSGYYYVTSYSGKNISLGQQIASLSITAFLSIAGTVAARYVSAEINSLSSIGDAKSALDAAFQYKKNAIALVADDCGGASAISVGVTEYAKQGNNTIYSAWKYNVTLGMGTYAIYTGSMKVRQST